MPNTPLWGGRPRVYWARVSSISRAFKEAWVRIVLFCDFRGSCLEYLSWYLVLYHIGCGLINDDQIASAPEGITTLLSPTFALNSRSMA